MQQNAVDAAHAPASNPSGLLFDISGVDLDHAALDRNAIDRWNPHRGAIVQLDRIAWHAEDYTKAVGIKHVREDEFWTSGHFPGNPIMPGVLMIEAGAQLASVLFYARRKDPCIAGFTRIEDTVFRGQVKPGDDLVLLCNEIQYKPRRFVNEIQGLVHGKPVFSSKITGMKF